MKGVSFLLRTISERSLFGLKLVWRGQVKVSVSDPTRTVLDMLSDPRLGGGLRPTVALFRRYLRSENSDLNLLIEYGERLGNGAVFKRLGFLLERLAPEALLVPQTLPTTDLGFLLAVPPTVTVGPNKLTGQTDPIPL